MSFLKQIPHPLHLNRRTPGRESREGAGGTVSLFILNVRTGREETGIAGKGSARRVGPVGRILTETNDSLLGFCLLLLRGTAGIILFAAGAGKVFGWFGGQGLAPTIDLFVTKLGIPAALAYLSVFTEFLGGFLLIVGFLTRPAAFAIAINMAVATAVMMPKGFLIGGAAYPFTLLVCAVVILLAGPMRYSVDSLLFSPDD